MMAVIFMPFIAPTPSGAFSFPPQFHSHPIGGEQA